MIYTFPLGCIFASHKDNAYRANNAHIITYTGRIYVSSSLSTAFPLKVCLKVNERDTQAIPKEYII